MGSALDADPRLGKPWPSCEVPVVHLTLDFGLGAVFQTMGIAAGVSGEGVPWNSGNAEALLRAVAAVKRINDDPDDDREYEVHTIWTGYCRNIANTNSPSYHSLWAAIDINPQENYRGIRGDIPEWFHQCFVAEGFAAGDDWSYTDPMHHENGRFYALWDGTYPEEADEMSKEYEDRQTSKDVGRAAAHGLAKMKAAGFKGAALPQSTKELNDAPNSFKGFFTALGNLEVTG